MRQFAPPQQGSTFTRTITRCGVFLLFLPKINIVAIEGFRAGLRIDDFVIALVVLYLAFIGYIGPVIHSTVFAWAAGFVAASWFSHLVGGGSMLFSVRMMEYLCLVIIGNAYGRLVKDRDALSKILYSYLLISLLLCVLQTAGLAGGIGMTGFTSEFGGRAIGLCNGPWELGIVVCFLFGYLTDDEWVRRSKSRRILVLVTCAVVLVLTAARTPLMIFLALLLVKSTKDMPPATKILFRVVAPLLAFVVLFFAVSWVRTDNYAVARLREFLNAENLKELGDYIVTFRPSLSYTEISNEDLNKYKDAGVDASMAIRLSIFSYMASNYYYGGPLVWLFGLGHGFSGNSTDMGAIRILCEVGLLGFVCFHLMLWSCAISVRSARLMVVALLINQLTLDVYIGYKTMFLFFLIVGYGLAMNQRGQAIRRYAPLAQNPPRLRP